MSFNCAFFLPLEVGGIRSSAEISPFLVCSSHPKKFGEAMLYSWRFVRVLPVPSQLFETILIRKYINHYLCSDFSKMRHKRWFWQAFSFTCSFDWNIHVPVLGCSFKGKPHNVIVKTKPTSKKKGADKGIEKICCDHSVAFFTLITSFRVVWPEFRGAMCSAFHYYAFN